MTIAVAAAVGEVGVAAAAMTDKILPKAPAFGRIFF